MNQKAMAEELFYSIERQITDHKHGSQWFNLGKGNGSIRLNGLIIIPMKGGRYGLDIPGVPSLLRLDLGAFQRAEFKGALVLKFERGTLTIESPRTAGAVRLGVAYKWPYSNQGAPL